MTRVSRFTVLLLLIAGSLSAGIDNLVNWNSSTFISSFGVTNTATYGQTVTIPIGAGPLTGFSFEIGNCSAAVNFRAEIFAWDGLKATGPNLYESAITNVPADAVYHHVAFNTGSLSLAPGVYVLFVSTSKDQGAAPASSCRFGSTGNTYPGGLFVFQNNGPDPTQWTITTWNTIGSDLAFTANFTDPITGIPAPSTLLLVVTGLIAVALFARYLRPAAGTPPPMA